MPASTALILAHWPPTSPVEGVPWALVLGLLGFLLWRELRARKIAERLRKTEARLQAAIESLPFDVWVMDADGRYSLLNSAAIGHWGNHIGKRPEELDLPAETLARWQENNRRAFTGQIVRGEITVNRDGQASVFENIVAPVLSGGEVLGILGVNIDITDRKLAMKAQRQSELRFRALVEHCADAICVFDAAGQMTYASASTERVLGHTVDQVVGRNAFEFIHPDDHAAIERVLREAIARPATPIPAITRARHRDGSWRLVEGTFSNLLGDPVVGGIVTNYRDITGPAAAAQALRESETRFHAFIDHSPALIFIKDADLRYVHVNRRFERVFGLKREDIIGRTDLEIFPEEQARGFQENDRRTIAANRATEFEESAQYSDGLHVSIAHKFPLRDAEGRATGLGGIITDITERRRLEEQLRQAQRMESIGQLAGGVAHDFNNLLTVIQGHASLMEVAPDLAPDVFDSIQQIIIAAQRAENLTRQLLAFSRRQFLLPRQLDLNEVVGEMSKMLRRILGEDIALQFQPGQPLPPVHADPGMIEHVLLNLALNARDAMPRGGRLVITTDERQITPADIPTGVDAAPGAYVRLRVSDNGTGIPAEDLPRIFEPFFTTKGVGKGTGLGLATVYGIVRQHHGWIDVTSTPGGGTAFDIHLPAVAAAAPAAPHTLTAQGNPEGDRKLVLVIEDDTLLRSLVCNVLKHLGYRAIEADTAVAALEIWKEQRGAIHLALIDLVLPGGVNGREFADQLRAERPGFPIIFVSGYPTDGTTRDIRLPDGAMVLRKPYHPEELAAAVRAAFAAARG
jgi:PAS domain S-box-containing protein